MPFYPALKCGLFSGRAVFGRACLIRLVYCERWHDRLPARREQYAALEFPPALVFHRCMKLLPLVVPACAALCALAFSHTRAEAAGSGFFVYFGTYTGEKSKGIYVSRFDTATGRLTVPELAAESNSPSFLAVHPTGRFLYAVNEAGDGKERGVSAFAVDAQSGRLAALGERPSGGSGPCHLAVDRAGKCVIVANYGGGSVESLPIGEDGKLGEPVSFIQHKGSGVDPERQKGPHAHCAAIDAGNRFAFVCDLGLDRVLIYKLAATTGSLVPNEPPAGLVKPGSGPRHIAFHPNGKFAYVINEMGGSVTVFAFDAARGALEEVETLSTLPPDFSGRKSCAEIAVHPSGKFVYASNRGHDSIAVFAADERTGRLTPVMHAPTGGKEPRNFAIDPTGAFLFTANQNSDSIVIFRIDAKTGRLEPTGQSIGVGKPVCVVFVPMKG